MAEIPTTDAVKLLRADIERYLVQGQTLTTHLGVALTDLKRDLYNIRGITWDKMYDSTGAAYTTANNEDQCQHLLCLLCIAYVFRSYSVATEDSQWADLSGLFKGEYNDLLSEAKLDIDSEVDTGASFLCI